MPSLVAWLDHNEEQRRRMREVIDLFREHDTLDEIGVGSIRDSFSEILFPGTSTIHTRARYLLFIPWVYGQLERQRVPSSQAAPEARRLQVRLINSLEAGGESSGVIGIEAKASLKRLPDEVYWSSLRSYGIRLFHGSIGDYHRSLDSYHRRLGRGERRAESEELYDPVRPNWHAHLPPAPADRITLLRRERIADQHVVVQRQETAP